MLKKINFKYFQSHRNTTIKLSSGITGIIGKSLAGKTALLRGIKLLATNRPAGFTFHSNFTDEKRTTISASAEKSTVTLSKGKTKPTYEVVVDGKKLKPFKGFGRQVPDRVQEILNISDINIQEQLEPPFLITSPPGRIAEAINKATNIERINDWIKKINRKGSKLKTKSEVLEGDIEELELKIDSLDGIEDIEDKILSLKKIERTISRLEMERGELTATLAGIRTTRAEIVKLESQLTLRKKLKRLEDIEKKLLDLEREDDCIAEIEIKQKNLNEAKRYEEQLIEKYIKKLKKSKECPTCYGKINSTTIKRIKREISTTI